MFVINVAVKREEIACLFTHKNIDCYKSYRENMV